jgi:inner membrane transporter RhtA
MPIPSRVIGHHPRGMGSNSTGLSRAATAVPPHVWFGVSAVFHYLGPSFAVLLFPAVGVLGVAWMRIASAAAVFAVWSNPCQTWQLADPRSRRLLVLLGACLAIMNSSFYLDSNACR